MRRFFIPVDQIEDMKAYIDGSDVHHIRDVLKKETGDILDATDGKGSLIKARIVSILDDKIHLEIIERVPYPEREVFIRVYQAIPRSNKFELIIEKLTELGINEIVPLVTERTVPRYTETRSLKKRGRWEKIALETMKRVGRCTEIVIKPLAQVKDLASRIMPQSLKVLPYELEDLTSLKKLLQSNGQPENIELIVGPEGGFSIREVDLMKQLGFNTISLGKRILTVETAVINTVSNIYYEFE